MGARAVGCFGGNGARGGEGAGAGEARRPAEADGRGRGLRPAVGERRLPAAAARLRALRRSLLPERRGKAGRRQLPPAAGAADLRGDSGPPLRVPDHAGLRHGHDRPAGRLARRELLAEGPRAGREVQVAGRPRAPAVGHCDHLRRARLPDRDRPEPRRGADAPRRARGRGRGLRGRPLRRGTGRGKRRPRRERREGRGRARLPFALQARELTAQEPGLRDRRDHRQAVGRSHRLPVGRTGQPPHDPGRHHRRRHAQPPLAAALLLLRAVRPDGGVRLVGIVGEEGLDRDARPVHRRGVGDHRHLHPHRRSRVLLGRAPPRGLRARPGEVGRTRARGARERPRGGDGGFPGRDRGPDEVRAEGLRLGRGTQLVPEPERQAGRRFRAHDLHRGGEDGADRPAENALFIRTQVSF